MLNYDYSSLKNNLMHEVQAKLAPRASIFTGSLTERETMCNQFENKRLSFVFGGQSYFEAKIPVEEDQFFEYLYFLTNEAFLFYTASLIRHSLQNESQILLFSKVFNFKIKTHKKFLKSFVNYWSKEQILIILKSQSFILLNELLFYHPMYSLYESRALFETIDHLMNALA